MAPPWNAIDDEPFAGIVGVQILERAHQEVAGKVDAFGANPARRATSMYTSDNVIGMPVRRSSTSFRQLLRGSSY